MLPAVAVELLKHHGLGVHRNPAAFQRHKVAPRLFGYHRGAAVAPLAADKTRITVTPVRRDFAPQPLDTRRQTVPVGIPQPLVHLERAL